MQDERKEKASSIAKEEATQQGHSTIHEQGLCISCCCVAQQGIMYASCVLNVCTVSPQGLRLTAESCRLQMLVNFNIKLRFVVARCIDCMLLIMN